MNVLIIYKSIHHHNTEKIAISLARELKADLKQLHEVKPKEIENFDLIGFGSGIYMWKHHKSLLNFVKKLPKQNFKKAFVFSTRGAKFIRSGHNALKKLLTKKGFNVIGEFSCLGWDTFGPLKIIGGLNKNRPNNKDIKKAKDFAQSLL